MNNEISVKSIIAIILIVIGVIQMINAFKDTAEWYENFFGVNPEERMAQADKNTNQIGTAGLLIGAGVGILVWPYISKNGKK